MKNKFKPRIIFAVIFSSIIGISCFHFIHKPNDSTAHLENTLQDTETDYISKLEEPTETIEQIDEPEITETTEVSESIKETEPLDESPELEQTEKVEEALDATIITADISIFEQMLLDAGYGTVVDFGDGGYGVLMQGPDHTINGKDGGDLLMDYLSQKGLYASSISGGWMNEYYYNWFAENVYQIPTPEWSGDGEWEVYE